jgi:hypothetical protein
MARRGLGEQLAQVVGRAARDGIRQWLRSRTRRPAPPTDRQPGRAGTPTANRGPSRPGTPTRNGRPAPTSTYPGDFTGVPDLVYAANPDGLPDPGEIVWTWVPYEEDHQQGKDRPVLLVGHDGSWLLGLMLTSKDHDRDAAQEARYGRRWLDIGSGAWDRAGRPSEVRLDRVLRVDPAAVRRAGATLDRARFDAVAAAVRALG